MRRLLFFAPILGVLMLTGCGGGGGGTSLPSPYAGAWVGTLAVPGSGGLAQSNGPSLLALSVDTKGNITGSWTDSGGGGAAGGSVTTGGTLTLSITMPGSPPITVSSQGVTNIAQTGDWVGSLTVTTAGAQGNSFVIDLARH